MITYSIDTNAILRFLLSDNKAQSSAVQQLFHTAKRGSVRVVVEEVVFVEAVYVLMKLYKFQKFVIVEKLTGITNLAFLDIAERSVIQHALTIFLEKNVSIVDSLLLAHAQGDNVTLYTFDKKLAREAKIHLAA